MNESHIINGQLTLSFSWFGILVQLAILHSIQKLAIDIDLAHNFSHLLHLTRCPRKVCWWGGYLLQIGLQVLSWSGCSTMDDNSSSVQAAEVIASLFSSSSSIGSLMHKTLMRSAAWFRTQISEEELPVCRHLTLLSICLWIHESSHLDGHVLKSSRSNVVVTSLRLVHNWTKPLMPAFFVTSSKWMAASRGVLGYLVSSLEKPWDITAGMDFGLCLGAAHR